ncbi:MAG: hypothetical protein JXQ23_13585 [Clostridia bacterium]|nr:hypothetical protein [Clostridia bacterium]
MFGISDFGIWLVYLLCIASALLCLIYGIINWNKGGNDENELKKDAMWEAEDSKIEENI